MVYKQFLPYADYLLLSCVDETCDKADTFFPDYSDFALKFEVLRTENFTTGLYIKKS